MSSRARGRADGACTAAHVFIATLAIVVLAQGCSDGDAVGRDDGGAGAAAAGGTTASGGEGGETTTGDAGRASASGGDDGATTGGEGGVAVGGASGSGAECSEDADCVPLNECYSAACEAGACVGAALSRGSACESGFCNGFARCLPCLDDAPGTEHDMGCDEDAPMCAESASPPVCVGCEEDSDCDDGVPCTLDRCEDSVCERAAFPVGATCLGGVCNGQAGDGSCVPCLGDEEPGLDLGCTVEQPRCDTSMTPVACTACRLARDCDDHNECTADDCGDGVCEHATRVSGTPCLGGYCNGISGVEICVPKPCDTDAACNDGATCTADVCEAFACTYTADHGQCPDSGDVCKPNVCTVGTGCQQIDNSRSQELLSNGDLESGNVDWAEMSVNYSQVIFLFDYVPTLRAHTEPYIAWLGGGEGPVDEHNSLSQQVSVPASTVRLELSFFYQVWTDDLPDDQNSFRVRLRSTEANQSDEDVVVLHNQDGTRVWTRFTGSLDVSAWAGESATLEFSGTSAGGFTAFFIDTISLSATTCE